MPTLLGIHGSVTRLGRLHQALESALAAAAAHDPSITTELLHLGDHQISFADGRPPEAYGDDTQKVLEQVTARGHIAAAAGEENAQSHLSLFGHVTSCPWSGMLALLASVNTSLSNS